MTLLAACRLLVGQILAERQLAQGPELDAEAAPRPLGLGGAAEAAPPAAQEPLVRVRSAPAALHGALLALQALLKDVQGADVAPPSSVAVALLRACVLLPFCW